MQHTILMVSDEVSNLSTWAPQLEMAGYEVLRAVLNENNAGEQYPYWRAVLQQCREENTPLAGVLLYDASIPADDLVLQALHQGWKEMGKRLKDLDAEAERLKPRIEVDSGDPTADSNTRALLQGILDRAYAGGIEEDREELRGKREAAEFLLTANPPSQRGLDFLTELRKQDSPYNDAVVVVEFAHPGKKDAFLRAGATTVNTSMDPWHRLGSEMLLKELGQRGLAPPKKPGGDALVGGAKTPLDHVCLSGARRGV